MSEAGVDGYGGGGMVWFYSGWVNGGGGQVVAKFLRGVVMGVEVAWWMGGVEQMTTARAGTSRKTGSAHVFIFLLLVSV